MSHPMSRSVVTLIFLSATAAFAADSEKSEPASKRKEQPTRISSKVDVQPVAALTEKESREISFAAGRILRHISQARNAIREKNKDEAAAHVAQGLKLIAIIDSVLPHSQVKTEIKSGDLVYTDEDDVTSRYVTLFDELERRDIISPIVQAKKETEHKQQQKHGKEAEAKKAPAALAVSHADITYSTAKLDIELARHMLNRAKRDLDGGKTEPADEALLTLQSEGVLFAYAEVDLPLEEVADNLKLAEIELKEGRPEDAKAALHVAMDELKRYEKLVGEKRGGEVKALHQEIDKLTAELGKGNLSEADREKHASTISEWWQRATKWLKGTTK
jgi:hypothetical protein